MISEQEYRNDANNLSAQEMIKKYGIGCFTLKADDFKPDMFPEHFRVSVVNFQDHIQNIDKEHQEKLEERRIRCLKFSEV